MSWLQEIKNGGGVFGGDDKTLPSDYRLLLEKLTKGITNKNLTLDDKTIDDWADFWDYVNINQIELNDIQLESADKVDAYIAKQTFKGNQNSLYKEQLSRLIVNSPLSTHENTCAELEWLFPAEYEKKLPTKGGWILVARDIPVEKLIAPVKYGVYYAKGFWSNHSIAQLVKKKYGTTSVPNAGRKYQVKVSSHGKEVVLNPHEYVLVPDVCEILRSIGEDYEMVKGGGSANIEMERVHYLMSRGMSQESIYLRLLATVKSMTFCHFEPKSDFIEKLLAELSGKRMTNIKDNPLANFAPPTIEKIEW